MAVKFNIYEHPYVVTMKKGETEIHVVMWGESREIVRQRAKEQYAGTVEIVDVKER